MTEDRTRQSGTDNHRTDSNVSESTTADDTSVTDLAAENEQLRERVAELEAALADVQATLDEQSADTSAATPGEAGEPIDAPCEATADDTDALVTSGGHPTKVIGRLSDDQGIGVLGEATASSTVTYGVEGITQSVDLDAAGVRASASNGARGLAANAEDNYAIEASATGDTALFAETDDNSSSSAVFGRNSASSGQAYGVRGDTNSTDENAFGVRGEALDSSGATKGVAGSTYGGGDGAAGVYGEAKSSSGVVHGVKGETNSPDGYGLYTPDDTRFEGSMSVRKVGVSTYLGDGDQTVDSDTDTTVAFNKIVVDHFKGMDRSTGVYTVQEAGDYHISFAVDWSSFFSEGVEILYDLQINGSPSAQGIAADTTTNTSNQRVWRSFSRTAFGLSSGDTIKVVVNQDSGSQKDIFGFQDTQETYMTIHKVG